MSISALLIVGLTLGDEGKGGITDLVCNSKPIGLNIRFAADPLSAHYIVSDEGETITFGQVGSGMLSPFLHCHLGHESLIRAGSLMFELDTLASQGLELRDRLTIDPRASLVLPWHGMVDRMLELTRADKRHGTSGVGTAPALEERRLAEKTAPCFGDLFNQQELRPRLEASFIRAREIAEGILATSSDPNVKRVSSDYLARCSPETVHRDLELTADKLGDVVLVDECILERWPETSVVLEGTQGMLLNPRCGFRPHVSACDSSKENALRFLDKIGGTDTLRTVGVIRSYATRFGPGPLVTEDANFAARFTETHNEASPWHGEFRAGPLDVVSARYAIRATGGVDLLAVNHLDRIGELDTIPACTAYEYIGDDYEALEDNFEVTSDKGRILATDIRSDCNPDNVTRLLGDMRPGRYEIFDGWHHWSPRENRGSLPREVSTFVQFLESSAGLSTRVGILSFGPRRSDKLILCDL